MPLSNDAQVNETSNMLVNKLREMAGGVPHSFRPAHAKGHLLSGVFTPTSTAASLSTAPQFNTPSTPLTVRFSSSTGMPQIPDNDANANPRGLAIRFHLPSSDGKRQHTDIITHSTQYFPTRTGAEFLEFLQAATGDNPGEAVPEFLGRHPETARFLNEGRLSPESFATEKFFGVNAYRFINKEGQVTTLRYRILPVAEEKHIDSEALKEKPATYLFDELPLRLESGELAFRLVAQIAQEGDVTNDATVLWPEDRKIVELGVIKIQQMLGDSDSLKQQKTIIFDPIPRINGVEPSDDPLLDVRASIYLISGRQRRAAE